VSDDLHVKAHNALAAAVEMYRAVLQAYQDREKVLLSNVQMLKTQLAEEKAKRVQSGDAVREPEAKREVPRDGGARSDLALDGGALGQGEQGQEAPGPKEERSKQVGEEARSIELAKRASAGRKASPICSFCNGRHAESKICGPKQDFLRPERA
jgi:hypothetical protein